MKKRWIRGAALALSLGAMAVLSGCAEQDFRLNFNPQELYALPELPAKYTELNSQIAQILQGGAEYAAPISGTNVQPVQMRDLDGDGREEAVAFFRDSTEEKPLKIYMFSAMEDSYELTAVIEGSGTAFSSIDYSDLNGDGFTELVVGWKVNTELQAMSVYALRPYGTEEVLKNVNYVKYTITNLDQDGCQELMVLRADEEGNGLAECYKWEESGTASRSTTAVSMSMAELSRQGRLTRGTLAEGVPALFVTGVTDLSRSITDVLILREGELSNIVLSSTTGVTREIADFTALYPQDINGDGVTEVPCPVALPSWGEGADTYRRVDWWQFDARGNAKTILQTYHEKESGWYLQLPESWTDRIKVSRSALSDESVVTFHIYRGEHESPTPFLRIATISGTNREIKAVRGGRFILSRQLDTIYTAELMEANGTWEYGLTPDEVRAAFSLIATEWTSGD